APAPEAPGPAARRLHDPFRLALPEEPLMDPFDPDTCFLIGLALFLLCLYRRTRNDRINEELLDREAEGPQDVQPLPAAAHPRQEALPHQQPAGVDQLLTPQRMAGIHEIAARAPGPRPLRGRLLPLVMSDELMLLVRVGFPEEAGHLVITRTDAAQQVLD